MSRLIGKTAVITGAAIGIGRAVAQRFVREVLFDPETKVCAKRR